MAAGALLPPTAVAGLVSLVPRAVVEVEVAVSVLRGEAALDEAVDDAGDWLLGVITAGVVNGVEVTET